MFSTAFQSRSLPGSPMPDLPGRGSVGLRRDQEGAFLRPARPSGHRSGRHGGGRHGRQRRRTRRGPQPLGPQPLGPQPLRQGPADRRQGFHFWRAEGRGGGPRHRPPDAAPQEHARSPRSRHAHPSDQGQTRRGNRHRQTLRMFAAQTTKARDLRSFVNRRARKLLADNFSLMAAQLSQPRNPRIGWTPSPDQSDCRSRRSGALVKRELLMSGMVSNLYSKRSASIGSSRDALWAG
jgi:hypothetical protein